MHEGQSDGAGLPKRRIALALVLAIIAVPLVAGGGYLVALGGSPYYVLTGIALAVSAWYAFAGSGRAIQLYLAMLLATLVWALFESRNVWGIQARVLAPAILAVWVAWPWLRRLGGRWLGAAAAVVLIAVIVPIYLAVRDHGSLPGPDERMA